MEITKVRDFIVKKTAVTVNSLEFNPVLKSILTLIGSFLLMNPFVAGEFSPFGVSLAAASSVTNVFWAGAGTIIGTFFFFEGTDCVKYCAAILLCILIRNLYERYLPEKAHRAALLINSFSSFFLTGMAIIFATSFNIETFLTIAYESSLCCAGTFLFFNCSKIIWGKKEIASLTSAEIITIVLTLGIVLMPFYKYKIFGLSPVTLLFAFITLLFAKLRNSGGGALCGISLGFVAGLSSEIGLIGIGYASGGLLGGELSRKGRLWCAAGYIFPVVLCAFSQGTFNSFMMLFEGLLACIAFAAIPESFYAKLSAKVNAPVPTFIRNDDTRFLAEKLRDVSFALSEVSSCVMTVQNTLKPATDAQLNRVLKSSWCKVCSECELRESCRSEVMNPRDEDIEKIAHTLLNRAELDETRFPKGFYASCYSFSEMQSELKNRYLSFVASQGIQGHIEQLNSLMCEQFNEMAEILVHLSYDFDEETSTNADIAGLCATEAKESGLNLINAECYLDKLGRATVTLNITQPRSDFNITQFTNNLSTATGTKLCIPTLEEDGENCTLTFMQSVDFSISIGALSRAADSEPVCGDYYRSFRDDDGRYIIILSDGMGTGSRAAIDSAMATELFSKLIKAGVSFRSALAVTNSALLVKSSEESLATLDVVCIDLYTGKADFMKAGAAATFIRHKENVTQLEQTSLPIGILKDLTFSENSKSLSKGDVILMVSDGVLGDCNNWIQHELRTWDTQNPPDALAEFIINSACERKIGKRLDDMTAIAVYIE